MQSTNVKKKKTPTIFIYSFCYSRFLNKTVTRSCSCNYYLYIKTDRRQSVWYFRLLMV